MKRNNKNNPSALSKLSAEKRRQKPYKLEYVHFRLTSDDKALLYAEAKAKGISPSELMRKRCLKQKVTDRSPEARQERRILINEANNVLSIARSMRAAGASPALIEEVENLLDRVKHQKDN